MIERKMRNQTRWVFLIMLAAFDCATVQPNKRDYQQIVPIEVAFGSYCVS